MVTLKLLLARFWLNHQLQLKQEALAKNCQKTTGTEWEQVFHQIKCKADPFPKS